MWACVEINAGSLRQMADAGVHDGIAHADLRKLASLGNGKHSGRFDKLLRRPCSYAPGHANDHPFEHRR
jgi:hypothetical protein